LGIGHNLNTWPLKAKVDLLGPARLMAQSPYEYISIIISNLK